MDGYLFVYWHFIQIRNHVNVVVMERYSIVYSPFHHITKSVKRGSHRWIVTRLLTFYSYSLSNQRRYHIEDLVCLLTLSSYKFILETWLSWRDNSSIIFIFIIYVITSTSMSRSDTRLITYIFIMLVHTWNVVVMEW